MIYGAVVSWFYNIAHLCFLQNFSAQFGTSEAHCGSVECYQLYTCNHYRFVL
jgi:hypothetical protein